MSQTPLPPIAPPTRLVKEGGYKKAKITLKMTKGKLAMFLSGLLFDSALDNILMNSFKIITLICIIVAIYDLWYGLNHE